MSRHLVRGALAAGALVASSLISLPVAGAASPTDALARQFHHELNAERAARGRAPLALEPAAASDSSAWANQLRIAGRLRHSGSGRAEIIGTGSRTGEITAAWMRSASHRDLVLDRAASGVGIGVSCDDRGRVWVVAQLARDAAAGRPARSTASRPAVDPGSGMDCSQSQVHALQRLYLAFLGRPADAGGLATYRGSLAQGHTLADVAGALAASPEHAHRYGHLGDAAFVDAAYRVVLGRAPDPGGAAHWREVLRHHGRTAVLLGFAESEELRLRSGWW